MPVNYREVRDLLYEKEEERSKLFWKNRQLEEEVLHLREVIRQQGEFILSLKHEIRDFLGNA